MSKKEDIELGIESTVMGIREQVIYYYKGTMVQSVITGQDLYLGQAEGGAPYQYQRRAIRLRDKNYLYLQGCALMTLERTPDIVTILNVEMCRSPELYAVREGVIDFMSKYLKGVKLAFEGPDEVGSKKDEKLVSLAKPRPMGESEKRSRDRLTWTTTANGGGYVTLTDNSIFTAYNPATQSERETLTAQALRAYEAEQIEALRGRLPF